MFDLLALNFISFKFLLVYKGFLFLPISIFLSIWSYEVSIKRILFEFSITLVISAYILILSILSPCPPFLGWVGSTLAIISWVLAQTLFMRVRCIIATRLERFGGHTLLILGAITQGGQIFGGVLSFLLVNIYEVFEEKPSCVFDYSYCKA